MTTDQRHRSTDLHPVETPYDQLLLVGSSAGLVRIAFEREGFHEVLSGLEERAQASAVEASGELDAPRRQLEEYFAGERTRSPSTSTWGAIGGFRRRALEAMAAIPFGQTRSYRELAEAAGNPAPCGRPAAPARPTPGR